MIRLCILFLILLSAFSCAEKEKQPEAPAETASNTIMEDFGDTPIELTPYQLPANFKLRKWEPTPYLAQKDVLGRDENSFKTPEKMEATVDFWYRIYSKYNSWQGILHDSKYIDLIYEEISFESVMLNQSLDEMERSRERRKILESKRKEIVIALQRIASGVSDLTELELSIKRKIELKVPASERKQELEELSKKGRLRFQLGQKDYIYQGMIQSGAYMNEIEEIFKSYQLPLELTRIVFVESSFNLNARSKVGASGIWQIMPSTGKAKGLARNYFYDYRNHPLEAAHAAAKLLKSNYRVLESWPLAITAYNYGATGIRNLSKELKTNKIEEMIDYRGKRWGFAAANFYASYLAVLRLEENLPKFYGDNFQYRESLRADGIRLPKSVRWSQLQSLVGDLEEFKELNPQFYFYRFRPDLVLPANIKIYIPKAISNDLQAKLENVPKVKNSTHQVVHTVTKGQTLSEISKIYGVSISKILANNQLESKSLIQIGQDILIPLPKVR